MAPRKSCMVAKSICAEAVATADDPLEHDDDDVEEADDDEFEAGEHPALLCSPATKQSTPVSGVIIRSEMSSTGSFQGVGEVDDGGCLMKSRSMLVCC